jgi:hypothetical protein
MHGAGHGIGLLELGQVAGLVDLHMRTASRREA